MSRYHDLCHAMQSGVAMEMEYNPKPTEPKHLRTGINSALCDSAALARLLIEKGVFSELEYVTAVTEEMQREVKRYEDRLNEHFGVTNITLG